MAKRKKKDERPIWTVDAETDPFKPWSKPSEQRIPKPFIWGVYTGTSMHYLKTVTEVVEMIKDNEVICYAHNGGKFDFHLNDDVASLFDHLNLFEPMKIIDGRLVSGKIGKCEIRDSWKLFPAPLREFGSKLEIEYWKLEKEHREEHMPEIKRYLMQDCVGLWNALDTFVRQYGLSLTIASAAMKQWEELSGIKAPKTDAKFFSKFQKYYYGGRTQCFQKGYLKGPMEMVDIRSAYPRAMLEEHPYHPGYRELAYPKDILGTDMITIDCISNGALPFRNSKGIMSFPRDNERRRYYVTGWEVIAAQETGALRNVQIVNAIRFFPLVSFKPYILHWYAKRMGYRDAGDDANTFFAKRFMNELYGRWAIDPDNHGNFMLVPWEQKLDHGQEGYEFNGRMGRHAVVRRDLDPWEQHYINVATAASITGWVRAYLWRALDACDDPVYCDTDSIIARKTHGLEIGKELGQWSYEGTVREAWIAGKKLYYLKGNFGKKDGKTVTEKMAAKGIKGDARKIKAAALGKTVVARSEAPTFSLKDKRGVYFQERRIRMTAVTD